jgi:hypothetical protein
LGAAGAQLLPCFQMNTAGLVAPVGAGANRATIAIVATGTKRQLIFPHISSFHTC